MPTPIREEVIQYLLYMSKGEGNFHIIALMLNLEEEGVSCWSLLLPLMLSRGRNVPTPFPERMFADGGWWWAV